MKSLKVNGRFNSISYIKILTESNIVNDLYNYFQLYNYIFHQDNAPCHASKYKKDILSDCVPALLDWPAKSLDLSPLEQFWNNLKGKMEDYPFQILINFLNLSPKNGMNIPSEMINNFYESLRARCFICSKIGG